MTQLCDNFDFSVFDLPLLKKNATEKSKSYLKGEKMELYSK